MIHFLASCEHWRMLEDAVERLRQAIGELLMAEQDMEEFFSTHIGNYGQLCERLLAAQEAAEAARAVVSGLREDRGRHG